MRRDKIVSRLDSRDLRGQTVSRLPEPETVKSKRWLVTITYVDHSFDHKHIEELEELQDLVEGGPDWNLIKDINIRLTGRSKIGRNDPC